MFSHVEWCSWCATRTSLKCTCSDAFGPKNNFTFNFFLCNSPISFFFKKRLNAFYTRHILYVSLSSLYFLHSLLFVHFVPSLLYLHFKHHTLCAYMRYVRLLPLPLHDIHPWGRYPTSLIWIEQICANWLSARSLQNLPQWRKSESPPQKKPKQDMFVWNREAFLTSALMQWRFRTGCRAKVLQFHGPASQRLWRSCVVRMVLGSKDEGMQRSWPWPGHVFSVWVAGLRCALDNVSFWGPRWPRR